MVTPGVSIIILIIIIVIIIIIIIIIISISIIIIIITIIIIIILIIIIIIITIIIILVIIIIVIGHFLCLKTKGLTSPTCSWGKLNFYTFFVGRDPIEVFSVILDENQSLEWWKLQDQKTERKPVGFLEE